MYGRLPQDLVEEPVRHLGTCIHPCIDHSMDSCTNFGYEIFDCWFQPYYWTINYMADYLPWFTRESMHEISTVFIG